MKKHVTVIGYLTQIAMFIIHFCTNTIENSVSFVWNSQIKIDRFRMKKHWIAFVLIKCLSAFNVQIDRAITVIQCFFREC